MEPRSVRSLADNQLLARLAELLRQSRRSEADLVAHIAEVDARKLYAREASPSMFAYCVERLHLSGAEAYLRIAAARASREHPRLLEMLADGRLNLCGVGKLAPYLTRDNAATLLARAVHKTKRQIQELIAEIAPRPDVPTRMRKLARRSGPGFLGQASVVVSSVDRQGPGVCDRSEMPSLAATAGDVAGPDRSPSAASPSPDSSLRPELRPQGPELASQGVAARRELSPDAAASPGGSAYNLAQPPSGPTRSAGRVVEAGSRAPGVIEPLAVDRYKVQFTASAALKDKLERLQALMPATSAGDLAAVIEAAVTEKLERLQAQRFARTAAPRKTLAQTQTAPTTRRVPAAVRRAVYERDGGRCRYVDALGRRCPERNRLEFHHRFPFGYGGDHGVSNTSLLCRPHNALMAELDYGALKMARHRGRKAEPPGAPGSLPSQGSLRQPEGGSDALGSAGSVNRPVAG